MEQHYIMLIVIVSFLLHELAHIFHYYSIKKSFPKIKINWIGIFPQITAQLTISEKLTNILLAIILGFIPVGFFNIGIVYICYFIGISLDLIIMICLFVTGFKYGWNKPLSKI